MANNSGVNRVQINQLERAVSGDINLIQQKLARAMQQRFARMMSDVYTDGNAALSFEQRGVATIQTVQSPLNSDVYGGLMMRISGATALIVDPGVLGTVTSLGSGDAEDSDYIYVDDPGVAAGSLTFVVNGGPGVRIDVIECEVVEVTLLNEPRDIFDVPTQTFVPTAVIKASAARLSYRIRQGSAGTGYPGHASGWLPLAIAIHPAATASFADVDFFDVRPLVADLARAPTKRDLSSLSCRVGRLANGLTINGGADELAGVYDIEGDGTTFGNQGAYVCQGTLKSTIPGASNNYKIDLTATDNFASGYSPGVEEWSYIMALFPEGLPRWVHYATTDAGQGERLPENTMGIITVSGGPVGAGNGSNGSLITPPTVTGLLAAAPGKLVSLMRRNTAFATNDYLEVSQTTRGELRVPSGASEFLITGSQTGTTTTTEQVTFDLGNIGAANIPFTCVGIWVTVDFSFTFSAQTQLHFNSLVLEAGGNSRYALGSQTGLVTVTGAIVNVLANQYFLPLGESGYGTGFSPTAIKVIVNLKWTLAGAVTITARDLKIDGFQMAG